jgi:hypothetical protein
MRACSSSCRAACPTRPRRRLNIRSQHPLRSVRLAVVGTGDRVGGTSAGAIAAGAAAAAELGRDAGRADAGYARLAALPANLAEITAGGHTRLYHLFQPHRSTAALYRLVAVFIGRGGPLTKAVRGLLAAIRRIRVVPGLGGIAIPTALLVGAILQGAP